MSGAEQVPRIDRLLETFLVVDRLEPACAFYEDVLNLERFGQSSERGCLFRLPGGQLLGLVARASASEPNALPGGTVPAVLPEERGERTPALAHLAFAVPEEELGDWLERLDAHGVEVLSVVEWELGGRSVYFRDPDGHLLELATPGLWEFY